MDVEGSVLSLDQSEEILSQIRVDHATNCSSITALPEVVEYSVAAVSLVDQSYGVSSTEPSEILTFIIMAE
jgi:hypothetical protein